MKLIGKNILDNAGRIHADAKSQLETWALETEEAEWQNPNDVKERYASVSFLGGGKTVFNIKGNRYRLFTLINYAGKLVLVKKFGTHTEYSKWDLK